MTFHSPFMLSLFTFSFKKLKRVTYTHTHAHTPIHGGSCCKPSLLEQSQSKDLAFLFMDPTLPAGSDLSHVAEGQVPRPWPGASCEPAAFSSPRVLQSLKYSTLLQSWHCMFTNKPAFDSFHGQGNGDGIDH